MNPRAQMDHRPAPRRNRTLAQIFGDRALWARTALPWFLGLFVVTNLLVAGWRVHLEEQRRQNLLLRDIDPDRAGKPVRYDWSVGEDLGRYLRYVPDARAKPLVIVSGMSQMYAINDPAPDDQIIAEHLDDALAPKGMRVFGMAAPNLSNEEALVLFVTALADPKTRPDVFLYGVCFDKFRNQDLRPALDALLRARPDVAGLYRAIAEQHLATHPLAARKMLASLEAPAAQAPKSEEASTVEGRLRARAERALPVVAARKDVNAEVQFDLFLLRNAVFRIKATTKRPILASRYELNQELLDLMLDVARREGVVMPMYVIPLNPQAETPYVAEQYEAFKAWVTALARERGAPFGNLEGAVPAAEWGEIDGQPDFKHFRGAGHKRTADALLAQFEPTLLAAGSRRRATR
jgi:hypothetical protein